MRNWQDVVVARGVLDKWSKSGWGFRAETVEDLMRAVSRIGTWRAGHSYAWRGVVNADWDIKSSLFRALSTELSRRPTEAEIRERERALLHEAREWGIGLELGDQATDLHILAIMQHHGLPTRLVDVTHDPMTAMFFACEPRSDGDGHAGAMFAFNAHD
jgi:FRG domain